MKREIYIILFILYVILIVYLLNVYLWQDQTLWYAAPFTTLLSVWGAYRFLLFIVKLFKST